MRQISATALPSRQPSTARLRKFALVKNHLILLVLSLAMLAVADIKPRFEYDFSKAVMKDKSYLFPEYPMIRLGAGQPIENGMLVTTNLSKEHWCMGGLQKLGFQEATFDITFRLDAPVKKQFALFTYSENAWDQAQLGFHVTNKGEALLRINLTKEPTPVHFTLKSKPMEWAIGMHQFRATLETDGLARIYVDGRLVAESDKAPGMASYKLPAVKWHPYVTMGCTMERNTPEQPLVGAIASIAIYDKIIAPAIAKKTSDDVNIAFKRAPKAPVIDGKLDDDAWKNAEWTRPFQVLGAESQTVNGLWETADDKFVRAAATAALSYDDANLYIAYRAPVPVNMKANGGDGIEFFLQPAEGGKTWQILVQADNALLTLVYDDPGVNAGVKWTPAGIKTAALNADRMYTIEIALPFADMGIKPPAKGQLWRGNFCRTGDTAGGLSTWAPVGSRFFAPAGFGKFVCDSRSAYFANALQELKNTVGRTKTDIFADAAKAIAECGDDAERWDAAMNALHSASNAAMRQCHEGKSLLVWNGNLWEDFTPETRMPFGTKETELITLEAPRKARAIGGFTLQNLSHKEQLLSMHFSSGNKDFEKAVRFRELAFIELAGGRMIPDPIFDLPIGTVLRIPGNHTSAIWLDVNTLKLKPGKYSGTITIVPGYSVGEKKSIKLELTVGHVDLTSIYLRTWTYALRWPWDLKALKDYPINTSCLIPTQFAPNPQPDGTYDFAGIENGVDDVIKTFLELGIPQKEIFLQMYMEVPRWSGIKLRDGKNVRFMEPGWAEEYGRRILAFRDYLKKRWNMGYDQFCVYTNDEPNGNPDEKGTGAWHAITTAKWIHSLDPKIQLFCNPWKNEPEYAEQYFQNFEILEPCLPRLVSLPDLIKRYRNSEKEIWSYSVLCKSVSPATYRNMFYKHLVNGFNGIANFYDCHDACGDIFYSYDGGKVTDDYNTIYYNRRNGLQTPSRRMEAWYLGIVDFKLAQFCMKRLPTQGPERDEWNALLKDMDNVTIPPTVIGHRLFSLAERLAARK